MEDLGYVFRNEQHFGPFAESEIKELLSQGLISTNHWFWKPGMTDWMAIEHIDSLCAYAQANYTRTSDTEFEKSLTLTLQDVSKSRLDLSLNSDLLHAPPSEPTDSRFSPLDNSRASARTYKRIFEYKRWFLGLLFGTALAGLMWHKIVISPTLPSSMKSTLNRQQVSLLERTANLNYSSESPKAVVVPVTLSNNRLQLVASTNIPHHALLRVEVRGDATSFLEITDFQRVLPWEVNENFKVFQELRMPDGSYLPEGRYEIKVYCDSCQRAPSTQPIYRSALFLGVNPNSESYKTRLREFHKEAKIQAESELQELDRIIGVLGTQFRATYDSVTHDNSRDQAAPNWSHFDKRWSDLQSQLDEAFTELDNPNFTRNLLYHPIYDDLKTVNSQIRKLHAIHRTQVNGGLWPKSDLSTTLELKNNIEKNLKQAQDKVDSMKKQLIGSNGFPERKGLTYE